MQSNADPIASVMREGSAGSKISSGNIAPLMPGNRWLWICYLKYVLWGCRNTGFGTLTKTWFVEAAWHVGRRSRDYGCKVLQNPVLVQWIKTSLMIKRLFLCLHPVQRMRLSCILPNPVLNV